MPGHSHRHWRRWCTREGLAGERVAVAPCVVWTVYEMANRLPGAVYKYGASRRPHGDLDGETGPQGSVPEVQAFPGGAMMRRRVV